MTEYTGLVQLLRRSFRSGRTMCKDFRKDQLRRLILLIEENESELCQAIYDDVKRSKCESFCFELQFVINEAQTAMAELDSWLTPKKVGKNLINIMDDAYTIRDALGVVLIISPWNYPINLLFCPLVGALAAGNMVVLKPSELASNTADLAAHLVRKYFDEDVIRVVRGGAEETSELLRERFDHIFYTGSPNVAKIVMEKASNHLTPVTLELGGMCPAIVDKDVDVSVVGRRIAWGKFMSSGQTCLAPNHVLCLPEIRTELVEAIRRALIEYYTDNPQIDSDYARIINHKHFSRLVPFLRNSGSIAVGGKSEESDLYIEPTVLIDVNPSDPVMQEEIFGPILPIITVNTIDEAIEMVNKGEKPLGLYIFTKSQKNVNKVLLRTSCGGVTVNDCILQMGLDTLPFGGVGRSGMGRYHGKYTFDTFSHEKAVLQRRLSGEKILWMRYPPYNEQKLWWTKQLATKGSLPEFLFIKYVPSFLLGLLLGYLLYLAV